MRPQYFKNNLREIIESNEKYYNFNREERNLAAIFYHTLLMDKNLDKFLNKIEYTGPFNNNDVEIYFEYAYLRDRWSLIDKDDDVTKKKLILDILNPENKHELEKRKPDDFNKYFGAKRAPSSDFIVSPANWSITSFDNTIKDNMDFEKACIFKWCFNAKPDIVIQTSSTKAICIEAKLESGIGSYPTSASEKKIFRDRGCRYMNQLELQRILMEEILGFETKYVTIVKNKPRKTKDNSCQSITWDEVFAGVDLSEYPTFLKEWLRKQINTSH